MNAYETIPQLSKMLDNLSRWLEAGEAYAKKKNVDPKVLLDARLFIDQYPLYRQVQAACDAAKFVGARGANKEAPKHADEPQDVAQLRGRIAEVRAFLEGLKESDFANAATTKVPLPWMPGKGLVGRDYVAQLAIPNFFFHVTTAYAILRHTGVELGKADYIGNLNFIDV